MQTTIQYIRDYQTGIEYKSDELLLKYDNNPRERTLIRRELYSGSKNEEEKRLVCAICNQPLRLCGGKGFTKQKLHFRHHQDTIDCPVKTSEKLTQKEIDCLRYNGAKESKKHKELKEFIYKQLTKDDRFEDPAMEKIVKIFSEKKSWRRPDVSAIFQKKLMVFEIQLQTTFLNVIVDREDAYKKEKTYIMWFFDNTNMEKFRFSEEDIFYANKSNAFVITNETMQQSAQKDKFIFGCCYKTPYIVGDKILERWENKLITFDDLKFDDINYKVYYYDFDKEKAELEKKVNQHEVSVQTKVYSEPRAIYPTRAHIENSLNELENNNYEVFQNQLRSLFIKYNAFDNSKVQSTIYALYSAKRLKAFGWYNDSLIGFLNNFFNHHQEYSWLIVEMIDINNLWKKLEEKDTKKTFQNKVNQWEDRDKEKDIKKYNGLFIELFPELAKK